MRDVDLRHALHQFHAEVRGRPRAGRRVVELAGLCLGCSDQLGGALPGRARRHHQHVLHYDHEGDRRVVLHHVEREVGRDGRGHGHRAGAPEERISIRRGLGHVIEGHVAAGAGPVLDDHRVRQVGHLRHQMPGMQVGRTAGRVGNDQPHRARGISLCKSDRRKQQGGHRRQPDIQVLHEPLLRRVWISAILPLMQESTGETRSPKAQTPIIAQVQYCIR